MIEIDKIYNEDCLQGMKRIDNSSIDAVICDPPYGCTSCTWDSVIPFGKMWDEVRRILKPTGNVVMFSSGMFTWQLIQSNTKWFRYRMIWKKNVPTGMCSARSRPMKYFEEICVFGSPKATYNPQMKPRVGKHKECYRYDHYCARNNHVGLGKIQRRYDPDFVQPSDVLEFDVVPNRNGKLHPTQKPVDLVQWLVRTYSNSGNVILDPCMGSGTTAVAALCENRHFVGFELDKEFYDISQKRIITEFYTKQTHQQNRKEHEEEA